MDLYDATTFGAPPDLKLKPIVGCYSHDPDRLAAAAREASDRDCPLWINREDQPQGDEAAIRKHVGVVVAMLEHCKAHGTKGLRVGTYGGYPFSSAYHPLDPNGFPSNWRRYVRENRLIKPVRDACTALFPACYIVDQQGHDAAAANTWAAELAIALGFCDEKWACPFIRTRFERGPRKGQPIGAGLFGFMLDLIDLHVGRVAVWEDRPGDDTWERVVRERN